MRQVEPTTLVRRLSDALFGRSLIRPLPDRVARAIRQQECDSEILICWVQFAAILFFGAFYALTPKAFGPDVPFEPVPVTLAIYAAFTAVRLYLAVHRRLTSAFLAVSVVVDIAVLTVTIWSFHLQYAEPPAVYLKAPTLLYMFIIIALRALRFEPTWVILAGASAAGGWLVLVMYALAYGEGSMMDHITHSFAEYATSPKILVGAEVDKIVAIVFVTAILALALERARRLLVRSQAEETARTELARFFDRDIAETIVAAEEIPAPGTGMAREAAIMFIDLRGFTSLSSTHDATTIVSMLGRYQAVVVPIVRRHRGSIITYLGDGIMVAFGATRENPTSAADALACTRELAAALHAWTDERIEAGEPGPAAGIGLAWGRVIYGVLGSEGRLEYAVIGDPVNRAARLQGLTKSERVRALVTCEAWNKAVEQGYRPVSAADFRSVALAGIAEPEEVVAIA